MGKMYKYTINSNEQYVLKIIIEQAWTTNIKRTQHRYLEKFLHFMAKVLKIFVAVLIFVWK